MAPVLMRNRTSGSRFGAGTATGVVVVALCLALGACSGGGKKKTTEPTTTQPPKVLTVTTATLKIGKVDIESAGPPNVYPARTTAAASVGSPMAYPLPSDG